MDQFAYLWFVTGSTYHMHDAFTGNYILSIENVPSGDIRLTTWRTHGV